MTRFSIHDFRFSIGRGYATWKCATAVSVAGIFFQPLRAAEPMDAVLKKATDFLVSQQEPSGTLHPAKDRNETAMTSLAILALAACGHQPGDPTPEGLAMRKALAFVLRPEGQSKDGYFGEADGSRMYGHGIVTLMLSEMLGMGFDAQQDELIRDKCRRAVELTLRAQRVKKNDANAGGWRYTPDDGSSDMSVTVWQTMALRSAKNAGLDVPRQAIDDAVKYMKGLYASDDDKKAQSGRSGGFGYQGAGHVTSTTAEGLLAMQVCGEYEAVETAGAAAYLLREGVKQDDRWFFYTTYYYAQGMYQRGGKHAEEARKLVGDLLLPLQSREGWWEGMTGEEKQGGKAYATSMAILSLAVKNHFLPIYQR